MIMTKEFVKEWVYECVARFTFKNPSVEKLAKTGTPPLNATVEIEQNSLRMINSHVKEVRADDNKVPRADGENQREGKISKKSVSQDKQSKK